ncbi:mitochondrial thiamine pyrophosphate carrier [Aplysia californica]|uniref:Mitochondrial thiamine pyrophosphate carrier n=1 Tax=Aplysia californica TaxID=6500 RepID=A0ABM1AD95_APLCA|nr:mitochondrial thiamine pyrophosphate carrier [Aplysia californica]
MVGYNPLEKVQLSHTEHALAGAVTGAVTRAGCQPLDVLKIRFQLQVEPLTKSQSSKYQGITQAVSSIVKEEGVKALWKGHIPAQVLSILYGVVQYASFEVLTEGCWHVLPAWYCTRYRSVNHTICGGISGCLSMAFVHPVDVIRTRFVAQGEPKVYKSAADAFRVIVRTEGVRGFYRGFVPAMSLIGPQIGFQFGLYSLFTDLWHRAKGLWGGSPPESLESLLCGTGSGFCSKLLVYPLDVVKKRLQVQGFEAARRPFGAVRHYSGMINCLVCVVKEEGLRGLYKGLSPSLLKSASVAGLNFCLYEQVRNALIRYHLSQNS